CRPTPSRSRRWSSRRGSRPSSAGEGNRSDDDLLEHVVDLPLGKLVELDGRAADMGSADHATADQQLLVHVVEDVATLTAEAVDADEGVVERLPCRLLVAGVELVPDGDELGRLAAE